MTEPQIDNSKLISLNTIIKDFQSSPFLFVGSGLTKRYFNTPSWKELLEKFASRIRPDFPYRYYETTAQGQSHKENDYPLIATLIEKEFNEAWYKDSSFRSPDPQISEDVDKGADPFHAEIASHFRAYNKPLPQYTHEIEKLGKLCEHSISGIITTNYDCFLDDLTKYQIFVGQNGLLSASLQGIGEIYKIHGSEKVPKSIIIDQNDYQRFDKRAQYLSAKLLTIFLENPIIFLGYSVSDENIRKILRSILDCLSEEYKIKFQNQLIFVEFTEEKKLEISKFELILQETSLEMTKVTLNDFSYIYEAIAMHKTKIPVRLLRHLKQELVEFTITNEPTAMIQVIGLEDKILADTDFVVAIGKASDMALFGLTGVKGNDWYRDIVMDNLKFSADAMLKYTYPELLRTDSVLPVYKYIASAKNPIPENIKRVEHYDDLICKSVLDRRRPHTITTRSVKSIIQDHPNDLKSQVRKMVYLDEREMNLMDLEGFLADTFTNFPDIFNTQELGGYKSDFRRLIRIYDFMKFKA